MSSVLHQTQEQIIEDRRRKGIDGFDEMWEGVLHMNPPASVHHQDMEATLEMWLRFHWGQPNGYRVFHQVAISIAPKWTRSFRTPDIVLLTPDQFHIDQETHFNGPPLVAVEIYSPGDESYEKLPFYAQVGVPEVWIIHRDTKLPEVYVLGEGEYAVAQVASDGWTLSEATGIRMKAAEREKLAIELAGDTSTYAELPA